MEIANNSSGGDAECLADLRGLPWCGQPRAIPDPDRSDLLQGPAYTDLHRLQFDLETTGLDEDRDRIFMISMRDSRGWELILDTGALSEAALIERFVAEVQARDPDVLENHNIFAFDLLFLVRRAGRLGVRLALGRDGSVPRQEPALFDTGDRPEPFVRWRIIGREIIDTQHAVRRFGVRGTGHAAARAEGRRALFRAWPSHNANMSRAPTSGPRIARTPSEFGAMRRTT